jgi:diguanylate cyclase (GGDEF)-like protein
VQRHPGPAGTAASRPGDLVQSSDCLDPATPALADALARLAEAEDTLRAIGAGEVDAFVISDGGSGQRVFTLTTADRPYRMFVESMRDGAATVSSNGLILYANRRFAQLLARPIEAIVGSPLASFVAGDPPTGLPDLRGPEALCATLELDLIDGNGGTVPVRVGASPLDEHGQQLLCLTFTDLGAQKAQDREIARLSKDQGQRMADLQHAQAALTHQATHDALTGLPNRALLVQRIEQALADTTSSGRHTAVIFVDLDGFKQVNDSHGHATGDLVLRRVAGQLVAAVRPVDTVARIGGDEFAVLAADLETQAQAIDIGTRVATALRRRRPDRVPDREHTAASVGIAISHSGRGTAETLIAEADIAMYHAKSRGGGRAEVFDTVLGHQVHERSTAQRMLQSALDERRLIAYYQPVIDLSTGRACGFEALARITERDGSVLPPAAFIPVAEETGLIVPLGAQILELSCHQASNWRSPTSAGPPSLAVNVSARQFAPGNLAAVIQDTLARTGLDARRLHIELTETVIIDLHPEVLKQLEHIRDLGVQIGLDDFGTGYASLTHLRRLPLTFVKIDRSFVSGLGADPEDERIVSAVVDLAANLGLRSIAEGVETADQLQRLRELGCDQAQGYLFARPTPPNDVDIAMQHPAW